MPNCYPDSTKYRLLRKIYSSSFIKYFVSFAAKQICEAVEKTETKDILREHFKTLCLSFHKLLDSDDFMDRLLNFVQLVVKVGTDYWTLFNF